jgi:hypothetical protein
MENSLAMEIGVLSNGKKPIATIRVGSVAISIYPSIVRTCSKPTAADSNNSSNTQQFKTYQSFQMAYYEDNRRVLQRRNTLEKARENSSNLQKIYS